MCQNLEIDVREVPACISVHFGGVAADVDGLLDFAFMPVGFLVQDLSFIPPDIIPCCLV